MIANSVVSGLGSESRLLCSDWIVDWNTPEIRLAGVSSMEAGNAFLPDRGAFPSAQFLNLTSNTSLVSLPALIRRADWVISNDSGPMHLAAAQGVRVFSIFGPTDPTLFGPYPLDDPNHFVVQAPVGDLKLLSVKDVYSRFLKAKARSEKKN